MLFCIAGGNAGAQVTQGARGAQGLLPHLPVISGHRGGAAAGYPENCIATFEHTLGATPAFFEVDPHLTKDSGIVLLHDATLERITTGHGKLNEYTLDQVEKLWLKDAEGKVTRYHLTTLEAAIKWAKGKAILNLDVKDVPLVMKAALVKKYDAFDRILFTVHTAAEARFFYDYDHRSRFSAFVMDEKELATYEAAGIPWQNMAIAYVGPLSKAENKGLYEHLHKRGVKVMVSAAPVYDKLDDRGRRAEAYRQILKDGADIIESDRPIEAAQAIGSLNTRANEPQKK
jgi:glycerophosphoryl diester phosphodiesterase